MMAAGVQPARISLFGAGVWWLVALLACLSVLLINGRPLFYYDSAAYVGQGTTALTQIGVLDPVAMAQSDGVAAAVIKSPTVDGSRSAAFAIVMAVFAQFGTMDALVVLNAVLTLATIALPMRVAGRLFGPMPALPVLVAVPVLAASAGALPFYVAYLMPDILTGVLMINLATLMVFARQMTLAEVLLALGLACLAVVSHLSHLAIAGLMLPLAVVVAPVLSRRRWWLPPLLVALVFGVGYGETKLLRVAAKQMANAEVVLIPFLTARMIQDGPGYAYLQRHCPDETIATCPLYDALQQSTNPERFTASHIIFERSPDLASFTTLDNDLQTQVSRAQFAFFFDVLREAPVSVFVALMNNVLIQARMFSVDMTVPDSYVAERARESGLADALGLVPGRIVYDGAWFGVTNAVQTVLYVASLGLALVLLVLPGRVPGQVKALAIVLFCAVLANALVCGGISQPATRYGGRAIWLLPLVAAILALFARRRVA